MRATMARRYLHAGRVFVEAAMLRDDCRPVTARPVGALAAFSFFYVMHLMRAHEPRHFNTIAFLSGDDVNYAAAARAAATRQSPHHGTDGTIISFARVPEVTDGYRASAVC